MFVLIASEYYSWTGITKAQCAKVRKARSSSGIGWPRCSKPVAEAEVIIGKQRHGPVGTVALQFEANVTRFADLAPDAYVPARTD